MQKKLDIRTLTILAMLSALAYVFMLIGRIPIISIPALVLKYDPKDIIIAIGGLLFGPFAAFCMSFSVSFIEMVTVSETGWIGFAMNLLSTCSFACTAAFLYRKRTLRRAALGLGLGWMLMTLVMLLWNAFLTPIYTGAPREVVLGMLIPVFLPFNLLKGGLNAGFTMLLYKPVSAALHRARLIPPDTAAERPKGTLKVGILLLSAVVILTCVLFILALQGKI